MEKEELLDYLSRQDWPAIISKLTAYTDFKVRKGKWWKRGVEDLASGFQPVDLVYESIEDLFKESRKWNRERYPSIEVFLKSIIDSKIYNLYGSYDHTYQVIDQKKDDREEDPMDRYAGENPNYLDLVVSEELLNKIYLAIEDDPELEEFVILLLDGKPPRDIAEELNVDIKNIYNRKKRLKRILVKILDEE
ncbi:MAG: sigma-70 family RNA polymerase sigma factor [Bacteroidetes bacterium]|nr:sigma-70 family RNA polymerase sigma factor [Bacteroidota bacterium]